MLFADDTTVVQFGIDTDRVIISRIINNDFTTQLSQKNLRRAK